MGDSGNTNLISFPNLLLIAGNGRNVGKTWLSCEIIRHFSKTAEVIGVKITPHFYDYNPEDAVAVSDDFVILEEKNHTAKDSSLFLQAGAKTVFFIMARNENSRAAFLQIKDQLRNKLVVCESGGLREFVAPGMFLFVNPNNTEITKTGHLKYNPLLVTNFDNHFDFDVKKLNFSEGKISISENYGKIQQHT